MNTLYISGCSYVIGAGLPDCHLGADEIGQSIGSNIRREFNFKNYENDSQGGCSNDRIRRKCIDWLSKNKDKWDDTLVVIGWTAFTRFEMVDEWEIENPKSEDNYIQLNSGISHSRKDLSQKFFDFMTDLKCEVRKTVRFGFGGDWRAEEKGVDTKSIWKNFYIRHYNIEDRYDKYLDNILYLQSFLKANNIKYVMFDSLWSINETKLNKKFESKYRLIDFTKWVWGEGKLSWTEHLLSIDPTNSETRVGEHDDHPNIKGHRIWSDLTINKIKKLYG